MTVKLIVLFNLNLVDSSELTGSLLNSKNSIPIQDVHL